jgi:hypothetical protein
MLTIINDTHISAVRSAGTTPATRQALRELILIQFSNLLPEQGDLLIGGDLFDATHIAASDLFTTYDMLTNWLTAHPSSYLYNSRGNHDCASSSNVMSSFDLLGKLLSMHFPTRYVHIDKPTATPHGYVIPHMPNQVLFDDAIAAVPECDFLFVHCNVSNCFAAQSDHSLNLSLDQIAACKAKHIVCAHEHHGRKFGKVTITGCQIPTSVADLLSPGDKQYAVIDNGQLTLHTCARRADEFAEMPWNDLKPSTAPFIRISGEATAEQASEALAAVAAYRRTSEALVVANAVKVQAAEGAGFEDAVADMKGFDVMAMLRDVLDPEEVKILEGLT